MTLTVEDGSVIPGAESYVTLAAFKTYCDARGVSYAAFTDTQLEQHARKAFDYLLQKYRGQWKGYRKDATQVADWPRSFVYLEPFVHGAVGSYPYLVDEDSIPVEVKFAQFELMIRQGEVDSLLPDTGQKEVSVKVGPISVEFDRLSEQNTQYVAVDSILKPYLVTSNQRAASTRIGRS